MPLILPGLLQTPAYVEALMRAGVAAAGWRDKALASGWPPQEIVHAAPAIARP